LGALVALVVGALKQNSYSAPPVLAPPATNWIMDPASREEAWREDIDFLAAELPRRHKKAFFHCRREDFAGAVAALRNAVPRLSDHEIVVGLMKLAAMLGDAHTCVQMGELKPPFPTFGVSACLFNDGPVVIGALPSQKDLIGCTVVQFAGQPIDEAFRRAAVALANENE